MFVAHMEKVIIEGRRTTSRRRLISAFVYYCEGADYSRNIANIRMPLLSRGISNLKEAVLDKNPS